MFETNNYSFDELLEDSGTDIDNQGDIDHLKKVLLEEGQGELDKLIARKKGKVELGKIGVRSTERKKRLDFMNSITGLEGEKTTHQLARVNEVAAHFATDEATKILTKHLIA